jgi:hypothetical protein
LQLTGAALLLRVHRGDRALSVGARRPPLKRKPFGDRVTKYSCAALLAGAVSALMVGQGVGGTLPPPLGKQLAKADIVAFAKIIAGDADTIPYIFRSRVTEALKGAKADDVICFQAGDAKLELGTEYLLLLEKKPEGTVLPAAETLLRVCGAEKNRSVFETNGMTRPLPVRYTYKVRSLCRDQTCPFGVEAVDTWSSGLYPLPDFVEGFQVGDGLLKGEFWVRKVQLIHALRWMLGAL